jgi:clan AA aspartic protease
LPKSHKNAPGVGRKSADASFVLAWLQKAIVRNSMGTFSVTLQVGDLAGRQFVDFQALVDTGASDTVLPQDVLGRLGIEIIDRFTYNLANETVVEYGVGEARLRLDGRERTCQVVFGPDGVTPLLGATTLQIFLLGVNPLAESLVPVTGLLK